MRTLPVCSVLVLLLSALPSCESQPAAGYDQPRVPETVDTRPIAADYPRMDGSTISYALQFVTSCRIHGVEFAWFENGFGTRHRYVYFKPEAIADNSRNKIDGTYNTHGTHESYLGLIGKTSDIILVSRTPTAEEFAAAKKASVDLEFYPVAMDGIVAIVNVENPITSISTADFRGIFSGKITDWKAVGGAAQEMRLFGSDRDSGLHEVMAERIMKGQKMAKVDEMVWYTMMGPENAVGRVHGAIGFDFFYNATSTMRDPLVKIMALDGVGPSRETIAANTYPLIVELYVVIRKDTPKSHPARLLRDWLFTDAGQAAVADSEYIPIRPKGR